MMPIRILELCEEFADFLHDESRRDGRAEAIAFPTSTQEVCEALAVARENEWPVTLQGARTGFTGGCDPSSMNMDICCLSDSNIEDWIGEWGQALMVEIWSVGVRRMPGPPSPALRAANLDGGGKILIMKDPEAFHDSCRKTELEEEMELR